MIPQSIYDGPAWARAKHFRRSEIAVTFSGASRQLVGANPNRMGLIISSPMLTIPFSLADPVQIAAADTSTTGIKLSRTLGGSTARILSTATFQETAGAGVVADLELVRSAVTYKLARFTTAGVFSSSMPLGSSDTIQWNVTTAIGASTADFTITFLTQTTPERVTLSVNSPVVDGIGITLNPGQPPLVLWRDVIGDAFTEDLYGISNTSGLQIGIWDIFY